MTTEMIGVAYRTLTQCNALSFKVIVFQYLYDLLAPCLRVSPSPHLTAFDVISIKYKYLVCSNNKHTKTE